MTVACKVTFYGLCSEAINFYKDIFDCEIAGIEYFKDHAEQFPMGLSDSTQDLIYGAELVFTDDDCRTKICVGDSPVMVFENRKQMAGCKDNITFEVFLDSKADVRRVYNEFLKHNSKINIPLQDSEIKCYASLIDIYGICWNISLSAKEALSFSQ